MEFTNTLTLCMRDLKTYNILSITKDKLKASNIIKYVSVQAHLILLCFVLWHFADNCVLFYKLKVCGSPAWSRSIGAIFPAAFAHFVSVSDFGNSRSISNFFMIIIIVTVICHE